MARAGFLLAAFPLAGFLLAGLGAAGWATTPARAGTGGSVGACTQAGIQAIHHHVVLTTRPPACLGLSPAQVNAAIGEALRAVAGHVRGKERQRRLRAKDGRYLDRLVTPVPGAPPPLPPLASRPVSQTALGLAALAAWLATVSLGLSMLARWITRGGWRQARRAPLNVAHLGLALAGLVLWIAWLVTGVTGLAWAGCAALLPVTGLGMTMVFPLPARHPPALVIAAHLAGATLTILLCVLAAIGPG
jgi:hypothetical protein